MKITHALLFLGILAIAAGQSGYQRVVVNLDSANWTHEKDAPDGSGGVVLHTDRSTGGMDLLVRFPAGHVIAPHFHDSNERVIVVEGQLTLRQDTGDALIDADTPSCSRARSNAYRARRRHGAHTIYRGTVSPIRIPRNSRS